MEIKDDIFNNRDISEIVETAIVDNFAPVTFNRAFPDISDGFKEVTRRILYSIIQIGCDKESSRQVKSAKIVGDVTGNLHPHSPDSVYGAICGLAADYDIYPVFLKPMGNFGNSKRDSYAHYRYTETKASKFAEEVVFRDFNSNIIDKKPTELMDGKTEPVWFSTRIPLILLYGTSGLGVGFICDIPPHNLSDVVKMCIEFIYDPEIKVEKIIENLMPDYTYGGIITNGDEIKELYKTGDKGTIKLKAKVEIDRDNNLIIVREFPAGACFNKFRDDMHALKDKSYHITKISRIIDKVSKTYPDQFEAWVYCDKDANLLEIYNIMMNKTCLKSFQNISFRFYDKGKLVLSNVKDVIAQWYKCRSEYIRREFSYKKAELEVKVHILEGLLKAYDYIDDITKGLKTSLNKENAIEIVIKIVPTLSKIQAKSIVEMQLYRLSNKSKDDIINEIEDLKNKILEFEEKLKIIPNIIIEQLKEIDRKYSRPRRTKILSNNVETKREVNIDDTILLYSKNSYLINDLDTFINSKNVINGLATIKINGQNYKEIIGVDNINKNCIGFGIFYSDGSYNFLQKDKILEMNHWIEITNNPEMYIIKMIPLYNDNDYLYIISNEMKLRKCLVSEFKSKSQNIGVINNVVYLENGYDGFMFLISDSGNFIMITENEESVNVPFTNKRASGVITNFDKNDKVFMQPIHNDDKQIILFFENDLGSMMNIVNQEQFTISTRTNKYKNIKPKNVDQTLKVCGVSIIKQGNKYQDYNNLFITKNSISKINSRLLRFNNEYKRISVKPLGLIQIEL